MASLTGTSGADTIDGTDGNDDIVGLEGADLLRGGGGNDNLGGDHPVSPQLGASDTLYGGDGNDFLAGGIGADLLFGEAGDDIIVGDWATGSRTTTGFVLNGAFALPVPGGGDDIIDGGAGDDLAFISYSLRTAAILLDNSDSTRVNTITVGGAAAGSITNVERLNFIAGSGDDLLIGGGGNDTLDGAAGNNRLYGGGGTDILAGGIGDDLFDGGTGFDTVTLMGSTASASASAGPITVDLRIAGPQQTGRGMDSFVSIEGLNGSGGDDHLEGDGENNTFNDGVSGNDVLRGNGGADTITVYRSAYYPGAQVLLDGGDGPDAITFGDTGTAFLTALGGDGDDTLLIALPRSAVIDAGAGFDLVTITPQMGTYDVTLGADRDTLTLHYSSNLGPIQGLATVRDFNPGEDRLGLKLMAQGLTFSAADPFLTGHLRLLQKGADTLIQIDANGGGDGFVTAVVLKNVAAASLTAAQLDGYTSNYLSSALTRTGSAGVDAMTGTAGGDRLLGLDGNDILTGGGGFHILEGGAGTDTAVYAGLARQYAIAANGSTVAGGPEGGTDDLVGVERLKFLDGVLSLSPYDAPAQVHRLYGAALGRAPDQAGLAYWVAALDGGQSLTAVAAGFIGSPEFLGRFGTGSDTQFLTLLYKNVLDRAPDDDGLRAWLGFLAGGHSRAEVVVGFSDSPEYVGRTGPATQAGFWFTAPNAAVAARFYDTVFGRLPDASGLTTWTNALNAGASLATVANGFVASKEFQTTYGALSNDAFVELMYHNVLGRGSDAPGKATWMNLLNAGGARADVVVGFSESPEHVRLTAPHIDQGVWLV